MAPVSLIIRIILSGGLYVYYSPLLYRKHLMYWQVQLLTSASERSDQVKKT